MLADKSLTYTVIESIIKETGGSFKANSNQTSLEEDASIISKISFAVSSSLKGNPRQAKRFLNTFFVRKNLASLYFGAEIDLSVMAKLLALETIDIKAFRKLYEWNSEFDGEIKQLKEVETCINNDKELNENYKLWKNPRVIRWVKSEPKNLYKMDLSKYFYLSRESAFMTKREMIQEHKDTKGFLDCVSKTISCSHPCNTRWHGKSQPENCGYCYPCLIRQSSLLDVIVPNEHYTFNALSYDYILSATDSRRSDLVDLLSSISAAVKSTDQALLKRIKQTGQLSKEESLAFLRLYKATISDLLELFSRDKDLMRMIGIEYASN